MNLCGKVSNNKHFDCPARMDDGRHFTDYRPACHLNNMIRVNNDVVNSYDYRMFLTNNATKLMDLNRQYSCEKNCSKNCVSDNFSNKCVSEENFGNSAAMKEMLELLEKQNQLSSISITSATSFTNLDELEKIHDKIGENPMKYKDGD